jgi:hypothetical protein
MPWSGKSFSERHNHALHGEAADKAASIANAILKRTGDEGLAIATANKRARSDGGGADIAAALSIARRAAGGFTPPSPPYFARQQMQSLDDRPYGFTVGFGGGRQDKNEVAVGAGSYVIPADIMAGLGDGNSLHGAKVWDTILSSMPWGIQKPQLHGKSGAPNPPHDAYLAQGVTGGGQQQNFEDGGEVPEVPIASADGETILSPEDVLRIGQFYSPPRDIEAYPESHDRMMRRAHRVLDDWIKQERGRNIKHLKSLAGPVGSKNASVGHT